MMEFVYRKADELHKKTKVSTNTIFLLYTVIASTVIGLFVMTAAMLFSGHSIDSSLMFIVVGALYAGIGVGFFGGVIYLMRR